MASGSPGSITLKVYEFSNHGVRIHGITNTTVLTFRDAADGRTLVVPFPAVHSLHQTASGSLHLQWTGSCDSTRHSGR
jgi:hypothetical protein